MYFPVMLVEHATQLLGAYNGPLLCVTVTIVPVPLTQVVKLF